MIYTLQRGSLDPLISLILSLIYFPLSTDIYVQMSIKKPNLGCARSSI